MPSIGPLEVGVVLVVTLIIFGPRRLPEVGRSLGLGLRGFRDSLKQERPSPHEPIASSGRDRDHQSVGERHG